MLLFDLTPEQCTSERHNSHPDSGNIRIEAKLINNYVSLPPAYFTRNKTALSTSIRHLPSRQTSKKFNGNRQFMCCLSYVISFLGVFPSDRLPRHPIARTGTPNVNSDPHTASGSHWMAIHFRFLDPAHLTTSIDTACLHLFPIQSLICRNCIMLAYNIVELQGPTSTVIANTADYSPCTWTVAIQRNNS